jgi:hypothetical protein
MMMSWGVDDPMMGKAVESSQVVPIKRKIDSGHFQGR